MTKFEKKVELAKEVAEKVKLLGDTFEISLDENGGYIEIGSVTVHLDENMNVTSTEAHL